MSWSVKAVVKTGEGARVILDQPYNMMPERVKKNIIDRVNDISANPNSGVQQGTHAILVETSGHDDGANQTKTYGYYSMSETTHVSTIPTPQG